MKILAQWKFVKVSDSVQSEHLTWEKQDMKQIFLRQATNEYVLKLF